MTGWKMSRVFALVPLFTAILGCGKSSSVPAPAPSMTTLTQPITDPRVALRVHWLGRKQISADRNATNLMKIWNLPEALKLQAQTLDKFSAVPWRLLLGQTNQASARLLRSLLDDVVTQECYLEVCKATNAADASDQLVLSVHLNADRANLWQTNVAAIAQSLGGVSESNNPADWILKSQRGSTVIELARAGEWTVLSMAPVQSTLLNETLARINSQHTPVVVTSTNAFLEGSLDLAQLHNQSGSKTFPRLSFALKLDEDSVVTTGELSFEGGERSQLSAWNIPTNLISASAVSITAIRGLAPYLSASKFWASLNAGSPPDQCYIWAIREFPMQTYFIAPMNKASNAVTQISEAILQKQGPWWVTNAWAGFQKSKTSDGLSWRGFPFFAPFLRSANINGENLLVGGFLNVDMPAGPPQGDVVEGILGKTNLVYFDRELTGVRVEQWIQLGQALRLVSGASQLPGDSVSFQLLQALGSRLGTCSTEIIEAGPGKYSFARRSDIGFSAIELHVLADWLESPEFPLGTYSLLVRSPEPPPL
jgi:hypothetical protein